MVSAKEVTKPHIAFLPSPGIGHLIPLLQFAKHLVIHHNVHVSFLVINTDEALTIKKQLLHSSTIPTDLEVINLPTVDVSSCVNDNILNRITYICEESFKHLRATLIELNLPKALIIDILTTDAILIGKELGIPVYSFFTSTTQLLALFFYLPKLDKEVESKCLDILPDTIQVPGCKPMRMDELMIQFSDRKHEEYKCNLNHVSRLTMVAGVFINTWDELELKSSWLNGIKNDPFYRTLPAPPIYPVGPMIKHDEAVAESHDYIISWLDNQSPKSVLLVSLGSGGTLTTEQLTELALGLEMSNQKFVWVVRKPNDLSTSGTFFNVGGDRDDPLSYLPEGFVKRTTGVGLVVPSWAPQVPILRHQATGGFLSHCGWNSTLESIVHGMPMIAWPLYAEQKMNATLLTEELAIAVKPTAVSTVAVGKKVVKREEIERVVRLLMEGEEGKEMRGKANLLKESAAKALKSGGSTYDLVSSIVESWK